MKNCGPSGRVGIKGLQEDDGCRQFCQKLKLQSLSSRQRFTKTRLGVATTRAGRVGDKADPLLVNFTIAMMRI